MVTTLRKLGNCQGVIIPKPLLLQTGMTDAVEMTVEDGAIVLRPARRSPREVGPKPAARLRWPRRTPGWHGPSSPTRAPRTCGGELPASVCRGDIRLAALDPSVGSDVQKTRPCVVVSPAEPSEYLRSVMVAPMTTGSHPAPFRTAIVHRRKNGLIRLDQLRTLDRQRLAKQLGQRQAGNAGGGARHAADDV